MDSCRRGFALFHSNGADRSVNASLDLCNQRIGGAHPFVLAAATPIALNFPDLIFLPALKAESKEHS